MDEWFQHQVAEPWYCLPHLRCDKEMDWLQMRRVVSNENPDPALLQDYHIPPLPQSQTSKLGNLLSEISMGHCY